MYIQEIMGKSVAESVAVAESSLLLSPENTESIAFGYFSPITRTNLKSLLDLLPVVSMQNYALYFLLLMYSNIIFLVISYILKILPTGLRNMGSKLSGVYKKL